MQHTQAACIMADEPRVSPTIGRQFLDSVCLSAQRNTARLPSTVRTSTLETVR